MRWLSYICLLFLSEWLHAQNPVGIPEITNYYNSTYNAGTENRGIAEDRNGVMYFANLEGLLTFDGAYWKCYPLPNKSNVRSVAIGPDGRIYAGGQDDFGYFSPDKSGRLAFTSLKKLLPAGNSFTDIWDILPSGNDVFFRSKENIFQYSNNAVIAYPATEEWIFLGQGLHGLLAQDRKTGLMQFSNGLWQRLPEKVTLPAGIEISEVFPVGTDSLFVTSITAGFFILHNNQLQPFRFPGANPFSTQRILTALPIGRDQIMIGTNLKGCYVINLKGEIVQNLSRKEGLQINNILTLFRDRDNNLWVGLDDGIDFIAYNNAIRHLYPEKGNEGRGYVSLVYNDELYVGTSNGLYALALKGKKDLAAAEGEFRSFAEAKGSCNELAEINGELLMGHHDGAFRVTGDRIENINRGSGYHSFVPLSNVLPSSWMLGGNERGIDLMEWQNGQFVSTGNLPGFFQYSQFVALDNANNIWVAQPYRGVYRIDIRNRHNPVIRLFTALNGLPSTMKNQLFKVKNRVLVATEKGVYSYNPEKDRFEPDPYFTGFFGNKNIRYLKEDSTGNVWFVENKNLGVIDYSFSTPRIISFPELNGKMVNGTENVYPCNPNNIIVGADKGFYHINYEQYKKNRHDLDVRVRFVKALGKTDSMLFGGYYEGAGSQGGQPGEKQPKIEYKWNSLHFEYSAPVYAQQNNVVYSYFLQGFDKYWSSWSKRTEKEYTNLPAGRYVFQVKAKNNLGSESPLNAFAFTVLPPWYQTNWAYAGYVLLFILINYFFFKRQAKLLRRQAEKHEEEQRRLKYLHELELEKSEKEIVKLRNEKLEAEIDYKNTELASTAMHLVQKGELLGNIKDELSRIKKNFNGHAAPDEFKKVMRILSEENKMDKDWEQFAQHFDHVHSDFLTNIKFAHPSLSPHELKLCAYLRMNLSSKEIAQLESISVRGVEIGRYRLRKKLKLKPENNLFDFMLSFSSPVKPGAPATDSVYALRPERSVQSR